ncbi:MAG: glycosyltransferase [Gammaproteobacteria bacterium]|nr:glycosyltransferase [Gammaproteobacteria bacterium]
MTDSGAAMVNFRVSRLSTGSSDPVWVIAVFAHNEADRIGAALKSVAASAGGRDIAVYVLANGCTDSTVDKVRACATALPDLWLVEIQVADKANAWNLFIHDIFPQDPAGQFETCFFMDGDVTLAPAALPLLASALDDVPSAEAAGGMPATGRDRDAWRQRMVANGMLAGNCYALRGSFVRRLREQRVRMPVGLIGEDFLVSWLVASDALREEIPGEGDARFVFHGKAEFSFRSLSPWRLADYRTYLRRKWRYALRGVQHQMLVLLLTEQGLRAMPRDVKELYRNGPLPSRLPGSGRDKLLHLIAVQWIRRLRTRAANQ